MRLSIATGALLSLLSLASMLSAEAEPRSSHACFPPGTTTLAADRTGRVYVAEHGGPGYACRFADGRPLLLTDDFDDGPTIGAIAGRFVAVNGRSCEGPGCYVYVDVFDSLLRKRVRGMSVTRRCRDGGDTNEDCFDEADVTSIAVKRNGSVAWIACGNYDSCDAGEERWVMRADSRYRRSRGPAELDRSPGILERSLRLSRDGRSFSWVKRGRRYSAGLR